MSKQTAVDFLVKKFKEYVKFFDIDENHEILLLQAIKQAKEMEKEQIKEAYNEGSNQNGFPLKNEAEQYYNETYKNEEK
jgi:Fe2+ or Zn2+ uptake regulation protein